MKTENSAKHIKVVAIIGMIVTALVAVVAIVLSLKKNDDDEDLLALLDDDFFDEKDDTFPEVNVDPEDEDMVLSNIKDTNKGFCGLRNIHCKCVQCDEKLDKCSHCENCQGVTDAVGEHEDCDAEGYKDEFKSAE